MLYLAIHCVLRSGFPSGNYVDRSSSSCRYTCTAALLQASRRASLGKPGDHIIDLSWHALLHTGYLQNSLRGLLQKQPAPHSALVHSAVCW